MGAEDFVKLSINYRFDFIMTGTSPQAELIFLRSLAWSGLNNSHGIIPAGEIRSLVSLGKPATLVAELVAGGYWEPHPRGWVISQWDKWQKDFEQVQAKRGKDAKRKRDERHAERAALYGDGESA